MKFFTYTSQYGDRVGTNIAYSGQMIFFTKPGPEANTFVTLEMPGLKSINEKSVLEWITARSGGDPDDRRMLHEIPGDAWRKPELADFIDAENHQQFVWWVNRAFDIGDIRAFEDEFVANLHAELDTVAALPTGTFAERRAREEAYDEIQERVQRIYGVLGQLPNTLNMRLNDMRRSNDEELLGVRYPDPFDLDVAFELARSLNDQWTRSVALRRIARDIASLPHDQATAAAVRFMEKLEADEEIRRHVAYDYLVFTHLTDLLKLEHDFDDDTLDISRAKEEVVELNYYTWNAPRIGRIVPGRRALVLRDLLGQYVAIVRGQRKLKHRVAKSKEGLVRHGVRLVMAPGDDHSFDRELLEVERLMTLAQVDPAQVVSTLKERDIDADHPVWNAAERAVGSPRWARVLADLAIEIVVGIDADVARSMLRREKR
jgi:hypothetical protein